jgi:SagB-type dehydrogenase family enzyme
MVEMRASVREYNDEALTLQELSFLLWCTQGVKMATENGGTMRTVPSAGARHAFETYLLVHRVDGIPAGLYRFLALGHALLPIANGEEADAALIPGFNAQNMVKNSAATFLWCANYRRMNHRYGPRSARYIFLDAGHVCQNLYLAGYTHRIGVCAIGAFKDDVLNAALGLDGEQDFVVYGATVGKMA